MKDMKPEEGTIYPEMRIAQTDVGNLEVETMAFSSEYPTHHIRFAYEITIQDGSKNPRGWGDVIFRGTLKELITLVNKANETSNAEVRPTSNG
jgi:hypothetical protein